jgi:hypothetical protein
MPKEIIDKKDTKDAKLMIFRQFFTIPFGFAKSLVILPLLSPELVFVIKIITTWFGYLPRLTLGTLASYSFYFPAAEVKNDWKTCNQYELLAWRFTLLGIFVGSVTGFLISIIYLDGSHWLVLTIWGAMICLNNYILNSFQARGMFSKMATTDIVGAAGGFGLALVGILWFDFSGYLWGNLLSIIIIPIIGASLLFPPKIELPIKFIKQTILSGGHFWFNGFLSDLAKTYDISMIAFLVINPNFGGQYAVAMTLASISDKVITSVSHVFQRKVVKDLAKTDGEFKNYAIINEFVILDMLMFLIASMMTMGGVPLFVYFLPKFSEVLTVLPYLLLGSFLLRFRYYPGIAFKSDNKFLILHAGHVIHLCIGIISFYLLSIFTINLSLLSLGQVLGASCGSIVVWSYFFARNGYDKSFVLKLTILIILISIWLFSCAYFADQLIYNITCVFIGGAFVLLVAVFFFREAFNLLVMTLFKKF